MNKKDIDKKVQSLLEGADTKKKALLVCLKWTDWKVRKETPLLTDEEVDAIKRSLKTDAEKREYNRWCDIFDTYLDVMPLIGLIYKEYQVEAEKVIGYLRQWEAYKTEENHLNIIYNMCLEQHAPEVLDVFEESIQYMKLANASIERDEDGFIEMDIKPLYHLIMMEIDRLKDLYSSAKTMVVVVEEYTRRTKSAAFRPELLIEAITNIKEDYAMKVAKSYSRKYLRQRINRGEAVTAADEQRAVFPSYDEIEVNENLKEILKKRFK